MFTNLLKRNNNNLKIWSLMDNIVISLIVAWVTSGLIFNLLNIENGDYFSLAYSGKRGLGEFFIVFILLTLIYFLLLKRISNEISQKILSLLILLFLISLYFFPIDVYFKAGILLLALIGFYFALVGLLDKSQRFNLFSIILSMGYFLLIIYNLINIPFGAIHEKLLEVLAVNNKDLSLSLYFSLYFAIPALLFLIFSKGEITDRRLNIITGIVFILQAGIIGRILWYRYISLNTPTYDFNLFAQMFHSMDKTGVPITTLERNRPLSHFYIHLSPVYYLLLPIFKITKNPGSLQILQAIIVASGIFPFIKIGKDFNLSNKALSMLSVIYLLSPALIASNFYDLHENCFLIPFLLWLFYFGERKKHLAMAIFTILILGVKEDAAIYLWTYALYLLLNKAMAIEGLGIFLSSTAYFIWALAFLNKGGEGAMVGRFDNMVAIESLSILSVPLTILKNPGFFLKSIFTDKKLIYIVQTLGALSFIPLLNKKYSHFILLIPYIVVNMISDYQYQADISFQYNYGSTAFLLYLLLIFLKDHGRLLDMKIHLNKGRRQKNRSSAVKRIHLNLALIILISLSIIVSGFNSLIYLARFEYFPQYYKKNKENLVKMKKAMDMIPSDASVTASPFLTGYLSNRKILYDFDYNLIDGDYYKSDYLVIDLRKDYNDTDPYLLMEGFLKDGYNLAKFEERGICILSKNK